MAARIAGPPTDVSAHRTAHATTHRNAAARTSPSAAVRQPHVHIAGATPPARMAEALRPVASARVLRIQHLQHLELPLPSLSTPQWADFFGPRRHEIKRTRGGDRGGELTQVLHHKPRCHIHACIRTCIRACVHACMHGCAYMHVHVHIHVCAHQITSGFWCTACPITRRGAVIHEHNRSVLRQLESFCKTEARGVLRQGPIRSCCHAKGKCHECSPWERQRYANASLLPWPVQQWVGQYAKLELPSPWPVCTHPFCTGSDRNRFP